VIDERTEELAAAYALGALEPDEVVGFEAQLHSNPELRALVFDLRGVSALVAGGAPGLEPSGALRARVIADMGDRGLPKAAQRRSWRGSLPWALAAGLAAVCVIFGLQVRNMGTQLEARQQRIDELDHMAEALRAERADLKQAVATLQQSNRVANMRIAVLNSQLSADPKAVAVSVWDNERQSGVVVVHHLKPAPKGKDYQLWIIDPRYPSPVDAGILQVDDSGDGRVNFKARRPIQNANQFAVTEEIKGGAAVPTLKAMVLAGA
jgi:anti-sigma-K factor RskA